jgi:aryl-alcohol dehydrogenase-like predicted oxidoreductase
VRPVSSSSGKAISVLALMALMAQVALAWVLPNPVVSAPIAGPTKPQHLADAAAAFGIRLTDDEAALLEAPYTARMPTGLT